MGMERKMKALPEVEECSACLRIVDKVRMREEVPGEWLCLDAGDCIKYYPEWCEASKDDEE